MQLTRPLAAGIGLLLVLLPHAVSADAKIGIGTHASHRVYLQPGRSSYEHAASSAAGANLGQRRVAW